MAPFDYKAYLVDGGSNYDEMTQDAATFDPDDIIEDESLDEGGFEGGDEDDF